MLVRSDCVQSPIQKVAQNNSKTKEAHQRPSEQTTEKTKKALFFAETHEKMAKFLKSDIVSFFEPMILLGVLQK